MSNTTLKVMTKLVSIRNENFVLVQIKRNDDGHIFYGTIPYTELDERGCMKRELNGLEMCLCDDIPHALIQREDEIAIRGMSEKEIIAYFTRKVRA